MVYHYRGDDVVSGRWTGNTFADLSAQQCDENTYTSAKGIADLVAALTTTVSIAFITQDTPSTFTFHMTDSTLQGPFTIPASVFNDRGAWAPLTAYSVNDTFNINGTLYLVIFDHTSAATFSAGANDGLGHNFYSAMLSSPASGLPTGGATAQVLQKSSGTDYAVTWGNKLPAGGSADQVLLKQSSTSQDADWATLNALHVSFSPSTASGLTSTNVASALEEIEANIGGGGAALHGLSDVNVTEGPGINGYFLTWNDATGKWVAGASSSNLSGLADVNLTEGVGINGFFLQWDNGSGKWIAAASSSSLAGLSDVSVTEGSGINGQFLKWNNGSGKWVASSIALSGLSDVNITEGSGINGYFLKWDNGSSKWVASLSGATAASLSGLTDVNVTEGAGIDGEYLKWNNGTSKWIAGALGTAATHAATDFQTADAQLFSNIPQNSKSTAYTTLATDAQKHIFHPDADTTARTWTIDSNANVPYVVGTAITFINGHGAGVITIAITSDTLRLSPGGTTGSRTLAADGMATAIKVTATEWKISGTGLT